MAQTPPATDRTALGVSADLVHRDEERPSTCLIFSSRVNPGSRWFYPGSKWFWRSPACSPGKVALQIGAPGLPNRAQVTSTFSLSVP